MTAESIAPWGDNLLNPLPGTTGFRIMRIGHLLDMLRTNAIYMPSIATWDDPYENVLRHAFKPTDKGVATFGELTRGMCALCFSQPPECVAMWRLYGTPAVTDPKAADLSIRVEFRLDALLDQVWQHIGADHSRIMAWAGSLDYLEEPELRAQIHDLVDATDGRPGSGLMDQSNRRIVRTLFLKRRAFAFEREMRILVDPRFPDADLQFEAEKIVGVRIPLRDPTSILVSVSACPWITDRDEKVVQDRLVEAGWTGNFSRSTIYDHPIPIGGTGEWQG